MSGYFSQQATQEHLDGILAEATPSTSTGWEKTIKQYFGADPNQLKEIIPDYHSQLFPSAYYVRDWLILVLPNGEKVEDAHLLPGLAALSKVQSRNINLQNVAIFGMTTRSRVKKDADGKTIKDDKGKSAKERYDTEAALGVTTTSTKDNRTLEKALMKLASQVVGSDYFLGENITAAVAKHITSNSKSQTSYESQIFGSPPFNKGDAQDRHGRLIMPARFKPSKVTELVKAALEGCVFKPDENMKEDYQK